MAKHSAEPGYARPDKVARQIDSVIARPRCCHGQRTMSAYPKVFRVKDLKRRTSANQRRRPPLDVAGRESTS